MQIAFRASIIEERLQVVSSWSSMIILEVIKYKLKECRQTAVRYDIHIENWT